MPAIQKKLLNFGMKTMTCKQLGGACDLEFTANTFEEVAEMSKKHGAEMFQLQDGPHLDAMNELKKLLNTPEAMERWFNERRREFEALSEN